MSSDQEKAFERIKAEIVAEADAEIKMIKSSVKEEMESISNSATKKAENIRASSILHAEHEIENKHQQTVSQEKLQAKMNYLTEREQLIKNTFSKAIDSLISQRGDQKYSNLMQSLVLEAGKTLSGGELIILTNKQDVTILSQNELSKLSKEIEAITKTPISFTIGEPINIKGGVIVQLKDGSISVDSSLEARQDRVKDEIRLQIISDIENK
ncbi:MAG: V-type ATP synthase subunit E [Candidatus Kariarchaeaceae archaeon]